MPILWLKRRAEREKVKPLSALKPLISFHLLADRVDVMQENCKEYLNLEAFCHLIRKTVGNNCATSFQNSVLLWLNMLDVRCLFPDEIDIFALYSCSVGNYLASLLMKCSCECYETRMMLVIFAWLCFPCDKLCRLVISDKIFSSFCSYDKWICYKNCYAKADWYIFLSCFPGNENWMHHTFWVW